MSWYELCIDLHLSIVMWVVKYMFIFIELWILHFQTALLIELLLLFLLLDAWRDVAVAESWEAGDQSEGGNWKSAGEARLQPRQFQHAQGWADSAGPTVQEEMRWASSDAEPRE